eukprot:scaffold1015_cov122-Skeletonema_dohrnii-CCMP3373.AAC.1
MCKERGLPFDGLKDELINLLVENDENAVAVVVSKHTYRVIANRNLIILVQQIVNNKDHPKRNYWNTAGSKLEQCERLCSLEKGIVAGIIRSTPGSNINAVDTEWDLFTVDKAKKAARTFFKAMVDGSDKHRPATDDEIRRATDTIQLPAQVEEQPPARPIASCITPAPARQSFNQGPSQRTQVDSALDGATNAEGNISQMSETDLLRYIAVNQQTIASNQQTQQETNRAQQESNRAQQETNRIDAGRLNLLEARQDQQGQQLAAHDATLVQQGQQLCSLEERQDKNTKELAVMSSILRTIQKKKGLNYTPIRSNDSGIVSAEEDTAAAEAGGGLLHEVQKDLFTDANTTTNGNAWDDKANDGDKEEEGK